MTAEVEMTTVTGRNFIILTQQFLRPGGKGKSRSARKMLCSVPGTVAVFAGIFLILTAIAGHAGEEQKPEEKKPLESRTLDESVVPGPIPVSEIAVRATEVSDFLQTLQLRYANNPDTENIKNRLPDIHIKIAGEMLRTMKILRTAASLDRLKTERQEWQKHQTTGNSWLKLLTERATGIQAAVRQLTDMQKTWNSTFVSARDANASDTVIRQIDTVLSSLEEQNLSLGEEHKTAIELQSRVAEELVRCETVLAEISRAQQMAVTGIKNRESLPIWSPSLWTNAKFVGFARLRELAAEQWWDVENYLYDPSKGLPVHLVFFLLLAVLFHTMQRKASQWTADKEPEALATVTRFPFTAALIGALILATSPWSAAPPTVRNLLSVPALAAIIRVMKPAMNQRLLFGIYGLGILFMIDTVRQILTGAVLMDHILVIIECLAGFAMFLWSLTRGNLQQYFVQEPGKPGHGALRTAAISALLFIGIGMTAGILGYMRVARLLLSGMIIGGTTALTLFAYLKIVCATASFAFRVRPLSLLHMVRNHRELFERRTYVFFLFLAIAGWSVRVLDSLGIFQPAMDLGNAMLSLKLERGAVSISLGDVFAFAVTVWIAYMLSAFIRFALDEDVYPRKNFPVGVSYAASQIIHYFILTIGFVMAIGVLGMDPTKITVLISAFSLGIGFGLQNVVNNFVSGLILLFERPIQIGHSIELGNIRGQVKRIGLRSSIVRTRQGADIIIPNSQLVSEQVTNWTFSDKTRRIELPVGVNYGAPPQKVMEVIESAATAHPGVLKNPPPQVMFMGFGDSSINFELWAWTDSYLDWNRIRSELAVAVYDAVQTSDFFFPFPQREVRLLSEDQA